MSRDDGPSWNKFCVIRTRLILRCSDPLVNNSLTFVEKAESIVSSNTISVGTFSGFWNSGTPLANETFWNWCGALFSLWQQTIFLNALSQTCSLHYNKLITKVDLPQLLGPATIKVNCVATSLSYFKLNWNML